MTMATKQTKNKKKLKFTLLEKISQPKKIKVDVTKASLTHAMKKGKYFSGFFLLAFFSCSPWTN